jgi:hypothetical protein
MKAKPIHILIDGADNTGKTTVCKILGEKLKLPVIKMPNMKDYIKNHSAEEFSKLFNETIIQFKKYDFILDRGFTSSLAYSKVHDRDFDLSYIEEIEKQLDPKVFIFTGMNESGFEYFQEDDVYTHDQNIAVDKAFIELSLKRGYKLLISKDVEPVVLANTICRSIL